MLTCERCQNTLNIGYFENNLAILHNIQRGRYSHFAGVVNGIACYLIADKRLCFARECSNRSGDESF